MAGLGAKLTGWWGPILPRGWNNPRRKVRSRPGVDGLEARELLTGLGTDYTLMGGQWDNSKPISFSFPPDGVQWDQGTDALNAELDSEFGGTGWQGIFARALQTWAASTNLNFVETGDGNYPFNAAGQSQGDPRFGDIRIGGYNFGPTSTIAETYGPPPDGATGAGDVELNTSFNFAPGSGHDLLTVAIHEVGHALGLGESPQPSSVMYTYYSGVRQALTGYDIEGIQSLYGPRTADSLQASGQATSPSTALNLTPGLGSAEQTQRDGVSLDSIGDTEYFSVVAPQQAGATLRVAAQAGGYSLLSPKITLIDPSTGATLGTGGNPNAYGDLASTSIADAQPGHRYLIAVTGATNDVFAVGSYAVQVGFTGGTPIHTNPTPTPTPTPTPSPTPTPTPTPTPAPRATIQPDRFEPDHTFATATQLGPLGTTVVNNLTITSANDVRVFSFQVGQAGSVLVASANTLMLIGDASAHPVAEGTGLIEFLAPTAGARYFLVVLSPNGQPVASFGFAIAVNPAPVVATPATPALIAAPAPTPLPTTTTRPTKSTTKHTHAATIAAVRATAATTNARVAARVIPTLGTKG